MFATAFEIDADGHWFTRLDDLPPVPDDLPWLANLVAHALDALRTTGGPATGVEWTPTFPATDLAWYTIVAGQAAAAANAVMRACQGRAVDPSLRLYDLAQAWYRVHCVMLESALAAAEALRRRERDLRYALRTATR